MEGKTKQSVDQCMTELKNTSITLQKSATYAEKEENKSKLEQAIRSLNAAKQQLSDFQD